MDRRTRDQAGEVMLNRSSLVEQPERVHRAEHRAQSLGDGLVVRRTGDPGAPWVSLRTR